MATCLAFLFWSSLLFGVYCQPCPTTTSTTGYNTCCHANSSHPSVCECAKGQYKICTNKNVSIFQCGYGNSGKAACVACPPGKYNPFDGGFGGISDCVASDLGYYASGVGQQACQTFNGIKTCTLGTVGAVAQASCSPGSYCPCLLYTSPSPRD